MGKVRRRSSPFALSLIAGVVLCSMTTLSSPSGATGASTKHSTLVPLVVAGPGGFFSDTKDETSGGRTGVINFNEASSADCSPTDLNRHQWVGSVLRYFDNNTADPETYVILCVTQFQSAQGAVANRNYLVAHGGSSRLRSAPIPGAYLNWSGPANIIYFSKGVYFVFVVGVDESKVAKGLAIASNVALRQYRRLPS
jgi:hypothetical protein